MSQSHYIDDFKTSAVKPRTLWSELKSLLLNDTHYRDYLPILNETEKQKVVRIYNDSSYMDIQATGDYWSFLPKKQPWDPSMNLLIGWIFLMFTVNTYFLYEGGIVLAFGPTVWNEEMSFGLTVAISWGFLLVYVADVFVSLNTGYYVDGILILNRKRILSRYIKTRFLFDLLSILIIFWTLALRVFQLNYAKVFLLFKLLQMNRMDYIVKRKLQIYRYLKASYLIVRILWIVMWISNTMGLVFYSLDHYLLTSGYYPPQYCWLTTSTAFTNIIDQSWKVQYLYSLYWGVNTVTTISYGDIAPGNPIEVVYSLVCFVMGFVVYSYVLNQVVQTVLWAKEIREGYRNQLVILNTFMRRKDISQQLQQKTTEYLQFLFEEQSLRDQGLEKEMTEQLPANLKMKLMKDAFKLFFLKLHQTFQKFPDEFLGALLDHIIETKLSNNEVIFQEGDLQNQSLYMLSKGRVNLFLTLGKGNRHRHLLKSVDTSSQTFGELEFLNGGRRRYKAVSDNVTCLYYVERKCLLETVGKSSRWNQWFCQLLTEVQVCDKLYMVGYRCQQCGKNHLFQNCEQLFPQVTKHLTFKSKRSEATQYKTFSRMLVSRRKSIHPAYRVKREAANEMDKYTPKLGIEQIVRYKLERRMALLQYHINQAKNRCEVDTYNDWESYDHQSNPSIVFGSINRVP